MPFQVVSSTKTLRAERAGFHSRSKMLLHVPLEHIVARERPVTLRADMFVLLPMLGVQVASKR